MAHVFPIVLRDQCNLKPTCKLKRTGRK